MGHAGFISSTVVLPCIYLGPYRNLELDFGPWGQGLEKQSGASQHPGFGVQGLGFKDFLAGGGGGGGR